MADPIGEARTAVEMAAQTMAAMTQASTAPQTKRAPTIGPVRYNLEAFGVAILGAVLLKWFCLEAFQIPTSSMQPTLMGSVEAGIYDRLLVDKLTPALREPQRWDVTVFSYPLQQNQNYVKRIVGMPGETLAIAGGNLYRVTTLEGVQKFHVLRKPERIQEDLWKEVYPARFGLHEDQKLLGGMLHAQPSTAWSAGGPDDLTVQLEPVPGRVYKLAFRDDVDGGFVDRVFDGYATSTAAAIRESADPACEIVPDGRISATFTPAQTIEELALEIEVRRPGLRPMTFALLVREGKCQLLARSDDGRAPLESAQKVCELPAGAATQIAFAHVDDELIAWRDGDEVLRLDVAAFDCREGCEIPVTSTGGGATSEHAATPQLRLKGQGRVQIDDLRICRDLHYTKRGFKDVQGLIHVKPDHYFMMGDNTLQSVDSRGWTSIKVGVLPDGSVVHPDLAAKTPGARVLRGNKRPVNAANPPDRDETPVVIETRDMMAMIDEFGDIHALKAEASVRSKAGELFVRSPGADGQIVEWTPPTDWVGMVPRKHIRGRALLIFWRWPFPRLQPIR